MNMNKLASQVLDDSKVLLFREQEFNKVERIAAQGWVLLVAQAEQTGDPRVLKEGFSDFERMHGIVKETLEKLSVLRTVLHTGEVFYELSGKIAELTQELEDLSVKSGAYKAATGEDHPNMWCAFHNGTGDPCLPCVRESRERIRDLQSLYNVEQDNVEQGGPCDCGYCNKD